MAEVAREIEERTARVIGEMGASVDPDSAKQISGWITTVEAWNKKIDLTAARSRDELVDLMLADALILAPRMPREGSVVDVGTGAGAPGLAVALLRPDLSVTLVEPLQKRVALLHTVTGEILIAGAPARVRAVRARGDEIARRGDRFDAAISRATLPPADWLRLGSELAPRGDVWVLLAREEPPTIAGLRRLDDIRYRWPLTGAERRAVRFARALAEDTDAETS